MAKLIITTERDFELIGKIKNLKFLTIMRMSYPSLARLTDDFREVLVNNLLYRGNTPTMQLAILEKIKKACTYYNIFPLPDYIYELQMNLEIGQLLTPKGFISLSPLEEEEEEAPQTSDSTDDMKAELEELREQVNAVPPEDEEIESLRNDLKAFQTMDRKGKSSPMLTSKQMAIFLKAILLKHSSLTNNVKSLAPLLQKFGGWTADTASAALGYKVTQEECDELAKAFSPYAPSISKIITDFPKEYDKIKVQKLSANLKK